MSKNYSHRKTNETAYYAKKGILLKKEQILHLTVITFQIHSLDSTNLAVVSDAVDEAMAGENEILLDLGHLRYLDMSGVAGLLQWVAKCDPRHVKLCSDSGAVRTLFELLRADVILSIFASRQDAISATVLPERAFAARA